MAYMTLGVPTKIDTIASHAGYFSDISRQTATEYLKERGQCEGTYLIRKSNDGSYRLSVLDIENSGECTVTHYKINQTKGQYTIDDDVSFPTMMDLINYYKGKYTDMCQPLTEPCPKTNLKEEGESDETVKLLSPKFVKLQQLLIQGPVCDIWRGKLSSTEETVIVKTANKSEEKHKNNLLKEGSIVNKLQHSNVVKFLGQSAIDPEFLVYEYSNHGTLLDYLLNWDRFSGTNPEKSRYCREIADALSYVTSKGYVHRNIRASNVLLSCSKSNCRLSGFGHAARLDYDGNYKETEDDKPYVESDIRWMAPEAHKTRNFTVKSDIWSFACIVFETFSDGQTPFSEFFDSKVLEKIREGYKPSRPVDMCYSLYYFLLKCLDLDAKSRPSLDDIQSLLRELRMPASAPSPLRKPSATPCDSDEQQLRLLKTAAAQQLQLASTIASTSPSHTLKKNKKQITTAKKQRGKK